MPMTDRSARNTSSTGLIRKIHAHSFQSLLARAILNQAVNDLCSLDEKERSDAASFFLTENFKTRCREGGVNAEKLSNRCSYLMHLEGVQRKRATKDLIEELRDD